MSLNSLGASNGHQSSRMTHSLSTPSGVDGSTSAGHHSRGGGKKLAVRVQMLDDSMTMFQVQVGNRRNKMKKITPTPSCIHTENAAKK